MNKRTRAVLSLFFLTIALFLSASTRAMALPTFSAQKITTHKVAPGETAYSIAKSYHIALKDLYASNPGTENGLKTGSVLVIPSSGSVATVNSAAQAEEQFVYHTIEKKETLYSVSRKYAVSMQNILDANPGLTADSFQEGRTIRIPSDKVQPPAKIITYELHKVQKGETALSISKENNISLEAFYEANPAARTGDVKKGNMVRIPKVSEKKITENEVRLEEETGTKMLYDRSKIKKVNTVKIGVVLPFTDQNESMGVRLNEYAEGFLLAVEDFKVKGGNAEIYIFNIASGADTKRLEGLLETADFKSMNVIIGGTSQEQIAVLSKYAKRQKIKYVIPFTSRDEGVASNPYLFQMNSPQAYLNTAVSGRFVREFADCHVIFVNDKEGEQSSDKTDFTDELQKTLQKTKISSASVNLSSTSASELTSLMSSTKRNIIVPTSGAVSTISKLGVLLQSSLQLSPRLQISLFGYPEWQTYNSQTQTVLHGFDTYFYSPFYLDNDQYMVKIINQRYQSRFNKSMINTYPKYGFLGYDVGTYFLNIVKQFGSNFENSMDRFNPVTLQSPISFTRLNNWGGFINTGFYFVHYGSVSVEKTAYSK
ncbi:MAG: LysM peptidoglycan-binding domain-containing protein [Dysgonamonadaceae bacterium]